MNISIYMKMGITWGLFKCSIPAVNSSQRVAAGTGGQDGAEDARVLQCQPILLPSIHRTATTQHAQRRTVSRASQTSKQGGRGPSLPHCETTASVSEILAQSSSLSNHRNVLL